MNNKTILQSHNEIITDNNISIDELIESINNLPEAGESAEPVLQEKTVSPTTSSQTITADTGYDGLSQVTVNAMTTATQATPSITVSSSGLITASATQTAGYVSAGTKSATKQLTTKAATTWTPKTSNQTIASGTYLTGTQTIKGDSNLVASNIKNGVSIFGVTGTMSATEDLSSELTEQNTLITTQETTIDNIISALEGIASGGGGSVETCAVRVSVNQYGSNLNNYTVMYIDVSDIGQLESKTVTIKKATNLTNTNGVSADINVVKGSLMVAHSDGNAVCTAPGMEYYENVTKLLTIPTSAGGTAYSTIICQIGQEDSGVAEFS